MLKRFLTPHERRMFEAGRNVPPILDPIASAAFQRRAEMDLAIRARLRKLQERLPLLMLCRMSGGSGFRMSRTLRHFFLEYFNRIASGGPTQMPSSFNVVEAFLRFSEEYAIFDLREEEEHLLRAYDFLNWYTSATGTLIADPSVLKDVVNEGIVYSYDMVGAPNDFLISTQDSNIALLGISLVRHEDELSVMLLAGENPPYPPDDEVRKAVAALRPVPGREAVKPDTSLTIASRIVPGLPDHSQIILLTRVYLESRRYDVRYVNLDVGQGYLVFTDDPAALSTFDDRGGMLQELTRQLHRYDNLFSALTALMYLPVYFIARQPEVVSTRFAAELKAQKNSTKVKRAFRVLGEQAVTLHRQVRCLASESSPACTDTQEVKPPELRSVSEGFWKELEPFEFGEDQDGNPIAGRTWVERRESWFTHDPTSFLVRRTKSDVAGPDPGTIYVMRSPAHERDLYKIGLTRRPVDVRAQEIGQPTGVPLPFGVLANWEAGDCSGIEAEVHRELAHYRVSKRREFFRAPLAMIVKVVDEAVKRTQIAFRT
jgi:hypothetical protein